MIRNDYKHMYDLCKQYMHSYVLVESQEGSKIDGIITGLDDEYVYMAVPLEQQTGYENQWGMHSPHHPHYEWESRHDSRWGYYPGYGYPGYGPGRRFRRLILPLAGIAALSLLPWY